MWHKLNVMHGSALKGVSFGLTSGIITTLGMMVGLDSGTHSKAVVISGILTIAVADAFSDALGMHISEESNRDTNNSDVWRSTVATFISKLFFALTFLVPVLFLELETSIIVSVIWGLCALTWMSIRMAASKKEKVIGVVMEHLLIAVLVILITHFMGDFIGRNFAG
jgi:vacuolar iron transporter family protein